MKMKGLMDDPRVLLNHCSIKHHYSINSNILQLQCSNKSIISKQIETCSKCHPAQSKMQGENSMSLFMAIFWASGL